jgi:hypothetical protein
MVLMMTGQIRLRTKIILINFFLFKYKALQTNEPQFYELITTALTPDQCKLIQNFITTANKRIAEKESRKILASGGYSFTNFNVPQQFNFGMGNPNAFSP